MSNTNNVKKQLQWEVSFKRTGDFPLDRSSIFNTYAEAMEYVNGTDDNKKGVPYLGQVITILENTILENGDIVKNSGVYVIKELPNEDNSNVGEIVRVSELVGGEAINISSDDNIIDVKIDERGGITNFIRKSESGLAVTGITADNTITHEEIEIMGGPLATQITEAFGGNKIPSGTSIEDFITKLVRQELWPVVTKNTPSCTLSVNAPAITSDDVTDNGLVEVGSNITIKEITANPVTVTKLTRPKVGQFEYGYSITTGKREDIEIIKPSDKNVYADWHTGRTDETYYTLKLSKVSGFTEDLNTDYIVTANTNTDCIITATTLTVVEGINRIKLTEIPADYTTSHTGIPQYYIVSNMGNADTAHTSDMVSAYTNTNTSIGGTKDKTFTVTGVYPIFTNGKEVGISSENKANGNKISEPTTPLVDEDARLSLKNTGYTFAIAYASQDKAPYKIYLPSDWEIKEAYIPDSLNQDKLTRPCIQNFIKNNTKEEINGINYSLYQWSGAQGADYVKFTI